MSLLRIPPDWTTTVAPAPGVSLMAWPPADQSGVGANLVLTTEKVDAPDLRSWQREVDLALPQLLADYHLLDLQLVTLGGLDGVRRLASHSAADGRAVTMEQWAVLVKGRGFTVTATTATLEFAAVGPALRAVAQTLSPLGAGARG